MKDLIIIICIVFATTLAREINQPENFGLPERFARDFQEPHGSEDHHGRRYFSNFRLPRRPQSLAGLREQESPSGLKQDFNDIEKATPHRRQQDSSNQVHQDRAETAEFRQPLEVIQYQQEIPQFGERRCDNCDVRHGRREVPERIHQINDADKAERYPQFRGGYFEDMRNNWEAGRISDIIQRQIEENQRFEKYWHKLEELKPAYEKFLANPKVQKLLEALSKRGVDTQAMDNDLRNTFGWKKEDQKDDAKKNDAQKDDAKKNDAQKDDVQRDDANTN